VRVDRCRGGGGGHDHRSQGKEQGWAGPVVTTVLPSLPGCPHLLASYAPWTNIYAWRLP